MYYKYNITVFQYCSQLALKVNTVVIYDSETKTNNNFLFMCSLNLIFKEKDETLSKIF